MAIANHLIYLIVSFAFTVSVGQSLFTNGKPFLRECLGTERAANAVNRLLLIGFYLLNIGLVCLAIKFGEVGVAIEDSVAVVAGRVGAVALVMGVLHFNNLFWCDLLRRRRRSANETEPI